MMSTNEFFKVKVNKNQAHNGFDILGGAYLNLSLLSIELNRYYSLIFILISLSVYSHSHWFNVFVRIMSLLGYIVFIDPLSLVKLRERVMTSVSSQSLMTGIKPTVSLFSVWQRELDRVSIRLCALFIHEE